MKPTLTPHHYRELVNELRDVASVYTGAQQLRAQLEKVIARYIDVSKTNPHRIPRTDKEKYQYGTIPDYPVPNRERR